MPRKPRTNPHGANQYQLDPRQHGFWERYSNPRSGTFSNALRSALAAGYTEQTANQITTELWFTERIRRMNMLGKAERVLDEVLDMSPTRVDAQTGAESTDPALMKIKQDTAKFVASTRGKEEGWSDKQGEAMGKIAERIVVLPVELIAKNGTDTSPEPDSE